MATAIDADPGLRAMGDCDVLVPRGRALEVIRILVSSGLFEPVRIDQPDLDIYHGLTLRHRESQLDLIDVHWRPVRSIGAAELSADMFGAARLLEFDGRQCLVPCHEHLLFHAIVHGADWSPYPNYQWLVDVTKILRRAGNGFDWQRLVDLARRYHHRILIGAALSEATRRTGVAVPSFARRRLRSGMALLERREVRLRRSSPSSLSAADELVLALQKFRRSSARDLDRPALWAGSRLVKSLFGSASGSRSFIVDDRRDRITLLQGWSGPDTTGRWTEGRFVSLAIYAPERPRPSALKLRGFPLRGGSAAAQEVEVFAGLHRLGVFSWPASGPEPHAQQLCLPPRIWRCDTAVLRLAIGRRVSPLELGLSGDPRALGIFVEELSVDAPLRDLHSDPLNLASDGRDREALWHGWCHPEPHGCWTFGGLSTLRWRSPVPIARGAALLVEIARVAPSREDICGRFRLDDRRVGAFRFPPATQLAAVIRLPFPEPAEPRRDRELAIEVDNPQSPAAAIGSQDPRPLGLMVRRVWLERNAIS